VPRDSACPQEATFLFLALLLLLYAAYAAFPDRVPAVIVIAAAICTFLIAASYVHRKNDVLQEDSPEYKRAQK